ncbi:MAG: LeuA family protein [Sedimentibacter sp.]
MNSWKTDKWYTSASNFNEKVTKDFKFKQDIKIHDVSLRDGEQQTGLVFDEDQKVDLAIKMAEMGIHRIEAGMPAVSKADENAIKRIVKSNLKSEIFSFSRCMIDDVKRAADCGVKGIVIEIPSNEELIKHAYGWDLEKAKYLSIEATQYAKEAGLYTVFFPIDMTRASIDWVLELVQDVATNGHMDALAVVDTFGVLTPHTVPYLIDLVKSKISKPIEVHFHDDFGLGSANTIMGLAAGADVAHTTISSIGERAGNASYEDVALSLLTMYGIDLGLDYSKIYSLSKKMREFSGLNIRGNRGIVGDDIFKIESGIVAAWYNNVKDKNPLLVSPYLPNLVGQTDSQIVLGKHSGMPSIDDWLSQTNHNFDKDTKLKILDDVKLISYKKSGLLTQEDFNSIIKNYV